MIRLTSGYDLNGISNCSFFLVDTCKYKVEPMGCFTDNVNDRAIPEEVRTSKTVTVSLLNLQGAEEQNIISEPVKAVHSWSGST